MLSKLLVVTALAAATTVLAGSSFMPPLPKEVLADLAKRDPSEYQTFTLRDESFIDRDRDNDGLVKRKVPKSLKGLQYTCKKADCMSITFDDGPYINMRSIVDTALAANIKVTFFLNSYNYGCSYDEEYTSQVQYAYKKGMQICNHSGTHPHFPLLTYEQIDTEIELVETYLHKVIGAVPACLRFPYGEGNETLSKYINDRHGLVTINWNEFSGDAEGATVAFSKNVYDNIKAPEQAIVLNHETYNTTAHVVFPYAIKTLQKNGYKTKDFMTVAESMGFHPYKSITKPEKRNKSWNCDAGIAARCATNPAPDICDGNVPRKNVTST